jgi:hypothetical protein
MTDINQQPATLGDRDSRAGECQTRAWFRELLSALAVRGWMTVSDLRIGLQSALPRPSTVSIPIKGIS